MTAAPNEVYANKLIGDGIIIFPTSNRLYAPVDGEIAAIFPTKHAIGITTKDNLEILLHFGIATAAIGDKCFKVFVKVGQKIMAGDLLLEADLNYIRQHALSDCVILAFTNMGKFQTFSSRYGQIVAKDKLIELK